MTTWREGVRAVIARLPQAEFSLAEVYDGSDVLKSAHPANRTANDTIRKVLQELRDLGELEFLDGNGSYRRLIPVPPPEEASASAESGRPGSGLTTQPWEPLNFHSLERAAPQDPFEGALVKRREFELQTNFATWLQRAGFNVERWTFRVPEATLMPDLVNVTLREIVEAKSDGTRTLVRAAIGQVLDYTMLARKEGEALTPALLFPARLPSDLEELCASVGIAIWWAEEHEFVRRPAERQRYWTQPE
jgi:hypothetical protein